MLFRSRIFEPYVTTKAKGTGLGLAIVKKIIDEHRGTITVTNIVPAGARVEIELLLEFTPHAEEAANNAGISTGAYVSQILGTRS